MTAEVSAHPVRVFDGHNDLPWAHRELGGHDLDAWDIAEPLPRLHTDLPRMREGGLAAQFWSVWVPPELSGDEAVAATNQQIDFVEAMCARYDEMVLARSADEVEAAWAEGRHAALIGMEGGHSIGGSLATLAAMAERGARYLTLTHNNTTDWADSATDEPRHGGLSDFGHEVVRELNRLGVIVDLSHVSAATMHDALDTTTRPVIFSHSNARAQCDHPRNVPDDVLARIPGNGGIVMVNFVPYFLDDEWALWQIEAAARQRRGEAVDHPLPPTRPGVEAVVRHLDYLREVIGIDHLGIGADFDGVDQLPTGLTGVDTYPRLFAALAERGWSGPDLAALAHGNALRVLREGGTRRASL